TTEGDEVMDSKSVPDAVEAKDRAGAAPGGGRVSLSPCHLVTRSSRWLRVFALGGLAAVALATALVAGTVPRVRREQAVNAQAAAVADSLPRVTVATARPSPADNERVLPGNALPLFETGLFPRATGYI